LLLLYNLRIEVVADKGERILYPDAARKVAEIVKDSKVERGILVWIHELGCL